MEKKNSKKPFFASFLEKQIKDPETIQGGSGIVTAALEDSVAPTAPLKDSVTMVTLDNATRPGYDNVTMKYPSDGDEDGNAV
ncbi:serine endopeptidase [Chryseobacterium sp. FH2]|uniref:microviridin/marinostatin family tricyclic proteinase inhibitor n=1 Tax=Chryseobacterium sp. FH2 TaxID=1674291 RepID=UPI00065AEEA9|nr:serine endopeptidase [Chryseobacterium sp. FH2]